MVERKSQTHACMHTYVLLCRFSCNDDGDGDDEVDYLPIFLIVIRGAKLIYLHTQKQASKIQSSLSLLCIFFIICY